MVESSMGGGSFFLLFFETSKASAYSVFCLRSVSHHDLLLCKSNKLIGDIRAHIQYNTKVINRDGSKCIQSSQSCCW